MSNLHAQAKSIFLESIELDADDERRKLIDEKCGKNYSLRREVERLLGHEEAAEQFLESPPLDALAEELNDSEQPTNIGPYVIREQIGEGGMGVVYVAEQTGPVQRKVALKVVKPGMDTKEVIARFEAERQALAFMEHPNIARVLDAGATDSGRSYFVMELVRGIPITEYCDQVKATARERLELFQTICDAVQHAHQKGIIHRDIKPSNVLVTQVGTKPVVKVIDFGLAKAISGQRLTEKTLYTGFMKLMGTPAYMSPEQAGLSGLDVDTRSDVYSLGVLLYELLTGTTPLDTTEIQVQAYDELCRKIREVDAPKPSTRFSTLNDAERRTVAQLRQVEQNSLRNLLNGDLDRVVLKAIEKDRDRRYGSPQDLAADIERFLDDKPVHAVPPSVWYLARKYLRRHKVAIFAATIVLLFLVLSSAISTWQAIRATTASNIADEKTIAAERSEKQALAAQQDADQARLAAVESSQESKRSAEQRRRLLYAANMQMADQLWNGHHGNAQEIHNLLAKWIPVGDELDDLRDFAWRHQWTRLHYGSTLTVRDTDAISISPNGNLIVADSDGIREWDEDSKQFVIRLAQTAIENSNTVSLSPCGRWVALMPRSEPGESNTMGVRIVELSTGDVVRGSVGNHVIFSRDGRFAFIWDGRAELGRMDQLGRPSEQHLGTHEVWDLSTRTKVETQERLSWLLSSTNQANTGSISSDGESFIFSNQSDFMAHLPNGPFSAQYEFYVMVTAFSPDGQLMADGQDGGDVFVRLTSSPGHALVLNAPHVEGVSSLMFSHDSKLLAVGDHDGTISIWDISDVYNLENPSTRPDGQVSGELPFVLRAKPSKIVRTLKGHLNSVSTVAFSTDGKKLSSRDTDGTAKLWDLAIDTERAQVTSQAEDLYGSSTGILLESTSTGVRVSSVHPSFQDITDGSIDVGDRIVGVTNESGFHEIGPDHDQEAEEIDSIYRLLAGPHNSTVEVHLDGHLDSGLKRKSAKLTRKFVRVPMTTGLTYSADGTSIFVADYTKGAVALTASGRPRRRFPILNSSIALSPNGNLLAMDNFNELVLWDLREDEPYAQWDARVDATPLPFTAWGGNVAFSADGKFVAMGTGLRGNAVAKKSELKVWDVSTGKEIGGGPLFVSDHVVSCMEFSPDGSSLLVGSHDGLVRIWNTSTWELERTYDFPVAALQSMAISPDGKTAAVAGDGIRLVIWDFGSGQTLHEIRDLSAKALDFSPDGKTLVAAGFHKKVILLDTQTGQRVGSLLGHVHGIMGCEFSPDERTLATVDCLGDLRLWEAKSLDEIDHDVIALSAVYDRAATMMKNKRYAIAERTLRRIFAIERDSLSPDHWLIEATEQRLVRAIKKQSQFPAIVTQPNTTRVRIGDSATLSFEISNNDSGEFKFQWFRGGQPIEGETHSSLLIPSVSVGDLGRYHVEVVMPDLGLVVLQSEAAFLVGPDGIAKGGLKKDVFLNIPNSKSRSLSELTDSPKFPLTPDLTGAVATFELPVNFGDEYGARIHGFIVPPKTGAYVFYLVSDDSSQLFLGTDDSPDNKRMIASLTGYNLARRGWQTLSRDNISDPITLQAGERYWIEALFREKRIGDHLSVTWQMPDEPPPKNGDPPIPGEFLEFQLE